MLKSLEKYIHTYLYVYPKFATPLSIINHLFYTSGNGSRGVSTSFHMPFHIPHTHVNELGTKSINFYFECDEVANMKALGDFNKIYFDKVLPYIQEKFPQYANLMKLDSENFLLEQIKNTIDKMSKDRCMSFYPDDMITLDFPYTVVKQVKNEYFGYALPIYTQIEDFGCELRERNLYNFVGFYGNTLIKGYRKYIMECDIRDSLKYEMIKRIKFFEELHTKFNYKLDWFNHE